jgi:hypothetical protein
MKKNEKKNTQTNTRAFKVSNFQLAFHKHTISQGKKLFPIKKKVKKHSMHL